MASNMLKWPKVILFGNSITQFAFSSETSWGALLADFLQRKCDVLNRGFSGYNTRWNHLILPRIIDREVAKDTVALVIFLGANDSNAFETNPRQHVPLNEYKENLKKMVDYAHSVGLNRAAVILITPPPCDMEAWAEKCRLEGKVMAKDNAVTKKYADACKEAAYESDAHCLDLYNSMMADDNWKRYLSDGLHLSSEGSMFLYEKLLSSTLDKLTKDLPLLLPEWKDVDYEDPQKSLL